MNSIEREFDRVLNKLDDFLTTYIKETADALIRGDDVPGMHAQVDRGSPRPVPVPHGTGDAEGQSRVV